MTAVVSIERLLADLSRQDIRLWVDDGRLRCTGPDGSLTPELTASIRARKTDILAFFDGAASPQRAERHAAEPDRPGQLSFAQQRLWFMEKLGAEPGLHALPVVLDARGKLNMNALKVALDAVIARHSILRTLIREKDGEPYQEILPSAAAPVRVIDHASPSETIQDLVGKEMRRPFDLSRELPVRLAVVRLGADRHLLIFTLHHVATDAWSVDVLTRDFATFYRDAVKGTKSALAPLPVQYGDFARWQRERLQGASLEHALSFWRGHLGTPLPVTQLPTDRPRPPTQDHSGAHHRFEIAAPLVARLKKIARGQGTTLFGALFTAFNILVHRYTGQADLIVGTPVANRGMSEFENLVGLFVNPLPVRSHVDRANGFNANLRATHASLMDVLQHQDMPFERLVDELQAARDPSASPLFQLKFQLDRARQDKVSLPDLDLEWLPVPGGVAKHDLSMDLRETGDAISGTIEYAAALFNSVTIEALTEHFLALLEAIAADPEAPVATLPLLTSAARDRQLRKWNETAAPYDETEFFHRSFEKRSAETPDAVALIHVEGDAVTEETYGALNRRANRLAAHLRAQGVGPESVVGIALARGPDMIAAWLAVLKAGAAYLPLDLDYPAERLTYMVEDAGARLVLTSSGVALPQGFARLDLDTGWPADTPDENPPCLTHPRHLAYTIYTSGSTGRPKGVLVEHGGLVNLTADKIRTCDVRPGDCVLQFFSFSFDASIPELVMSLAAGASLLLAPSADLLPGPRLANLLRDRRVTHVTMTPSALLAMPAGEFPDLRMVLVGGEAPSAELIQRWSAGRLFINAYGPTETTVNASMVACGNGHPMDATVRPSANKQLHVLDEAMEPLPTGVPGELYIGGHGLARGYHGRPGLTAERFLPNPFDHDNGAPLLYRTGDRACQLPDGRIRILGRIDDQVKVRGYRIELGEVEAALSAHPDVASVVATAREAGPGDKRLVAYAVPTMSEHASAGALRDWMAQHLPRFLVPDAIVWIDALPLTVNGKTDLNALPSPDFRTRRTGRAPEGGMEEAIAAAFRAVLGLEAVSAEDDFFEAGGHSLLATRLVAVAQEQSGVTLKVRDVFEAPTVAALARRAKHPETGQPANAVWQADTTLEAALSPAAPIPTRDRIRKVLLTGATGFLGGYLLRELLADPDCTVYCLLRNEDALNRLRDALAQDGFDERDLSLRLRTVAGDLAKPGLGIDAAFRAKLESELDAIVHNGAEVHHLSPYERLRAANVEGTREIIRLALAGSGRPLHHVSSLSVLHSRDDERTAFREIDDIRTLAAPAGGYNLSKWVAEHLVAEAARRGLPASIYRPGSISGDSRTGHFNKADILCRLMQGFLWSGTAPDRLAQLGMLPVDYVAKAIVHIARKPETLGRTFHLTHSRPVSSDVLFEACDAEGMFVRRIAVDEWRRDLAAIAKGKPDHPLFPLVGLFETGGGDRPSMRRGYDRGQAQAALADAPFAEPALDAALLRTYLRAFSAANALHREVVGDQS
ncbi:non-ribosomal peptide synthetase [Aquamicrobium sp. LC103]|uniref:non-ribosomal peptide synthetase n=1 Tax=Aquamicrobium sp. LC103 TaxID=1120658 RepID=UPI001FED2CA7|nr:non-ribosomal peptide synthetase [Aquamicrobium sp. LC103]